MSGHKKTTVSISQKEYQRLHEAEIKLRFLKKASKKEVDRIKDESVNALWENFDEIASRQTRFDQLIDSFNSEIKTIESGTNNAILHYQQDLNNQLQNYAGDLWQNTNGLIQEQNLRFKHEIEQIHLQNLQQISLLEDQIDAISSDQHRKFELAIEWINSAKEITRFIHQNYNHEKFFPSQLNQLISRIEVAQNNLENGIPEAAITLSQNTYLDLSNLRVALESKQNEWFILHQSILEELQSLYETVQTNKNLPGIDLNGNLLEDEIEIDYWSGRKLSRFAMYLTGLLERLNNHQDDLSMAFLQELQQNEIPKLHNNLERIIQNARLNALNSQLRINIADLVVRALEEQGFRLLESTYKNEDMRKEFNARVENIEGNQVEIQVMPNLSEICKNELFIHNHDNGIRTEHELHQRSVEISKSLQKYGLSVGNMQQIPSRPTNPQRISTNKPIYGNYKRPMKLNHYEQSQY